MKLISKSKDYKKEPIQNKDEPECKIKKGPKGSKVVLNLLNLLKVSKFLVTFEELGELELLY